MHIYINIAGSKMLYIIKMQASLESCHKTLFVVRIVKRFFIAVQDIFLALTTAQAKDIAIALAITLVRTS